MKTIPVEQISSMPMLVIFELLTALILLTVGILIVNKTMKKNSTKKLLASGLVGVLAGAAMVAVFFGVSGHVADTNDTNLRAAVTESGEKLNDEQIAQLKSEIAITLDEDKTITFSDEGKGYNLTIFDASENEKAQKEEDEERKQQIKDNDF